MKQIREEWIKELIKHQENAQIILDDILKNRIITLTQISSLSRFIGFTKSAKTLLKSEDWEEVDW